MFKSFFYEGTLQDFFFFLPVEKLLNFLNLIFNILKLWNLSLIDFIHIVLQNLSLIDFIPIDTICVL